MKRLCILFAAAALLAGAPLAAAGSAQAGEPLVIMPLGDSITHGSGQGGSYRGPLFDGLLADGWKVRATGIWEGFYDGADPARHPPRAPECRRHAGMSGRCIVTGRGREGLLNRLNDILAKADHADIVTLMVGTNDIDVGTPANEAFANWERLVKTLAKRCPDTWLVVSPIIALQRETAEDYAKDWPRLVYNTKILAYFDVTASTLTVNGEKVDCLLGTLNDAGKARFGKDAKIRLASMLHAIGFAKPGRPNPNFLDRLHPRQAGYDRMAAVWRAAIEQIVPEGDPRRK